MRVTLYVLKSQASGRRYVGITNDLVRQLREHSSGKTKAGQILGDYVLLHTEEFVDHVRARAREKFLKSGQGRKWLDGLDARTRPAMGG